MKPQWPAFSFIAIMCCIFMLSTGCDSADSNFQLVRSEFNAKSLEKIENLIIIEGIKQDSPPSDDDVSFDDAAGMIVYDDSFGNHSTNQQNDVPLAHVGVHHKEER